MKERKTRTDKQVWIICSLCLVFCAGETYAQRRGISMETKQEFLKAVAQGDEAKVQELLKTNPALAKVTDEKGVSALLQAVYNGRNNVADLLLASGIKLNIFEASATGQTQRAGALLKTKPNLANSFAADGFTPLGLAAFFMPAW